MTESPLEFGNIDLWHLNKLEQFSIVQNANDQSRNDQYMLSMNSNQFQKLRKKKTK
jgi:hypothetical protein